MRVLVVGGGYSGTAVALNLLRLCQQNGLEISLVERGETLGEGAAYGTKRREHLLNVPAGKMSCFPDEPDHLVQWLEAHASDTRLSADQRSPESFIPRQVFSQYLKSLLKDAGADRENGQLRRVQGEVVRADLCSGGGMSVDLASGKSLTGDKVVLCLGNEPSTWPFPISKGLQHRLISRPWSFNPAELSRQASVLVVGTGLTMADVITSLSNNDHEGPITAISRRGILPKSHQSGLTPLTYEFKDKKRSANELVFDVMEKAARHTSLGGDWREAVDGLRPWTVKLWRSLSIEGKRQLLTIGKSAWDVHRHRIAPEIRSILDEQLDEGRLHVLAGHVQELRPDVDGKAEALLKLEPDGHTEWRSFDHVINCTGPNQNVHKTQNPLLKQLVADGLALPGESGASIQVSERGRLLAKDGECGDVWVVGPQLIDRDFESIAVPELRQQALTAARGVLGLDY